MQKSNLLSKRCIPCESGTPPISKQEANKLLLEIDGWKIEELKNFRKGPDNSAYSKISKEFKFKNFKKAMDFVNKVAGISEEEGHHPDIYIFYSLVRLTLYTHAAGGLTENDFILAAKVNNIKKDTS